MNTNNFLIKAILSLHPTAAFKTDGSGTFEGLEWLDSEIPCPTKEQVEKAIVDVKNLYETTQYQRQRAPEYPPIGDQLDDLFHSGAFSPEMAAKIQTIKDKYPKG